MEGGRLVGGLLFFRGGLPPLTQPYPVPAADGRDWSDGLRRRRPLGKRQVNRRDELLEMRAESEKST